MTEKLKETTDPTAFNFSEALLNMQQGLAVRQIGWNEGEFMQYQNDPVEAGEPIRKFTPTSGFEDWLPNILDLWAMYVMAVAIRL